MYIYKRYSSVWYAMRYAQLLLLCLTILISCEVIKRIMRALAVVTLVAVVFAVIISVINNFVAIFVIARCYYKRICCCLATISLTSSSAVILARPLTHTLSSVYLFACLGSPCFN